MVKSTRRIKNIGLCALLSCLTLQQAHAAVFENKDLSTVGAGTANAMTAAADDIASALYNPAGLAWQQGVQLMFGNQSRYQNNNVDIGALTYEGDLALGSKNTFALSWMPRGGSWGLAVSSAVPYVSREDWSAAFPTLGGINLNMRRYSTDIMWRVNNTLGVAAGLDIYDTNLKLSSAGSSFSGSDWSDVGAHLGLRWEFIPFWALGIHYRQGVVSSVKNGANDQIDLQLPNEINIGVSHGFSDDEILLELDVKRTQWSAFKNMVVANNGVSSQNIAVKLRDTTDMMLGMTWFWRENTQLRFGYAYEQGANQSVGYQPLLSDASGHKVSLGFGGMMATMHFDMTWTGSRYTKVDVAGPYAGRYSDARYSFMFSLSKKF
jgi:long-subunit fatty acid transport protein